MRLNDAVVGKLKMVQSVYDQIGDTGFEQLVAAFYRRVAADEILNKLYPKDDMPAAERRTRMFLIQYFGGSTQYSQERGHPRLRMRHAPFIIGEAERDAWLAAMLGAMDEVGTPEPAAAEMRDYFERAAEFMMNASPSR